MRTVHISDTWILQCVSPEKADVVVQQDDQNSVSGVEIESPHKREKEESAEISDLYLIGWSEGQEGHDLASRSRQV